MELYTIILYSFFCFIGAILPGPTSLLALNLGLNNSIKAVFLASIGAAIADFLIICAIGFGLKQIIDDFPIIFEVIKTLGFFYLIFIAYMGEFKHEVRQFEKSYDNQQAEQISLMV